MNHHKEKENKFCSIWITAVIKTKYLPQAVLFLGSIRYDALKRVYDTRVSQAWQPSSFWRISSFFRSTKGLEKAHISGSYTRVAHITESSSASGSRWLLGLIMRTDRLSV